MRTSEDIEAAYRKMTENEIKFCEIEELSKNEHGTYIYKSADGNCSMNIVLFLKAYKDWLLGNKILVDEND